MSQSHEVVEIEPSESVYDGDIPLSRFNSEYNGHDNGEMFDSIHSQAFRVNFGSRVKFRSFLPPGLV